LQKGVVIIAALLGALVLVSLMGSFSFTLGALDLEMSVSLSSRGTTEIVVPPVGTISALTHLPPVKLTLTLESLNINLLERFLQQFKGEQVVVSQISRLISRYLIFFLIRICLLAFVGGGVGVYFIGRRDRRSLFWGGIAGLLIVCLLVAVTVFSYDIYAFNSPQFTGILEAAPWAFHMVKNVVDKVDKLGMQIQAITDNLYQLFHKIEMLPGATALENGINLLHVSDIHNNPVAFDLLNNVVNTFQVDLVVDTGDITDYGTPLEASLLERVGEFPVPYLFVPGNHDSPAIIETMKTMPNVTVIEEGVVEVSGIRIAGIADPASRSNEVNVAVRQVYREYIQRLRRLAGDSVDVIAAHHPTVVEDFVGEAPLLLTGHTHRLDIQEREGSVVSNCGTTGAAGIRGLQGDEEVPYTLVLFYLKKDPIKGISVQAADLVSVFQLSSGFSLERRVFIAPPDEP